MKTSILPKIWREAKVIAILKPNKPASNPHNYRPISLLSTAYKLFERLLLARIEPIIDKVLPVEQAGFRENRSCCDQVLTFTTYVENGYQSKIKSGAVFLDLSAAYDTVWKNDLLFKLSKILKCKGILRLIDQMLSNRKFKVVLNGKESHFKYLQNSLPQGSVLAPFF